MVEAEEFYFETRGFQNETAKVLVGVLLAIALISAAACGGSSRHARGPNAGLIIVESSGQASTRLQAIAQALLKEMRDDRLHVASYPEGSLSAASSAARPRTGAEDATKPLKAAWSAYYEMRLDVAWELVGLEMVAHPAYSVDGLRARLLAALIRFAEQDQAKSRRILSELPSSWPSLDLNVSQYPPKFIALYSQVESSSRRRSNEPLILPPDRPLTALRQSARHLAQSRRWKQLWLLRVISQQGMNRAELQEVREEGRRFTRYRSVRFGEQARPEKVAAMLWDGRAAI